MRRRLATLLAALALASLGLFAGAVQANAGGGDKPHDKCETSKGKAEGCPNHPDDGGEDDGDTPSCADLPDQALVDACNQVTGGGSEPPAAPSCADLPDQALVDACNQVTGSLPS
jgi:hypothetical protein